MRDSTVKDPFSAAGAVRTDGDAGANVVVADDHGVVRGGIRLLLQREPGLHVIGEAEDVPGALRLVELRRPDVLVFDLNMPGPDSLDAIPQVRRLCEHTHVVVLTMQHDVAFARRVLQVGADAYVLKDSAEAELIGAIREVLAGGTYLHPALGARMARLPATPAPPDDLSDREVEVLGLIAYGNTNAEIALQLHLSVRTVESHRGHVQQKLRLTTRRELVSYALERGLLDGAVEPGWARTE